MRAFVLLGSGWLLGAPAETPPVETGGSLPNLAGAQQAALSELAKLSSLLHPTNKNADTDSQFAGLANLSKDLPGGTPSAAVDFLSEFKNAFGGLVSSLENGEQAHWPGSGGKDSATGDAIPYAGGFLPNLPIPGISKLNSIISGAEAKIAAFAQAPADAAKGAAAAGAQEASTTSIGGAPPNAGDMDLSLGLRPTGAPAQSFIPEELRNIGNTAFATVASKLGPVGGVVNVAKKTVENTVDESELGDNKNEPGRVDESERRGQGHSDK